MEHVKRNNRFGWVKSVTGVLSVISITAALLGALTIVVDVLGR